MKPSIWQRIAAWWRAWSGLETVEEAAARAEVEWGAMTSAERAAFIREHAHDPPGLPPCRKACCAKMGTGRPWTPLAGS